MQIVNDFPPNFEDIAKKFDLNGLNPVFTYGDKLYNPTNGKISDDLMAHEEKHSEQQMIHGINDWWVKYLNDPTFRLSQELEAYQVQYEAVKGYNRDFKRHFLREIAGNLASRLYGHIIDKETAKELIKNGTR